MDIITRINTTRREVSRLTTFGVQTSPEWDRLTGKLDLFDSLAGATDTTTALADALLNDASVETVESLALRALAIRAAGPSGLAEVRAAVTAQIAPRLHEQARLIAQAGHGKIAAEFNETVSKLAAALAKADPSVPMASMILASEAVRKAYVSIPAHVAALDHLASGLALAFSLAGGGTASDLLFGLTIDTDAVHIKDKRNTWALWDDQPNRWVGLLQSGAPVHARPLDQVTQITRSPELITKLEPNGIGHRPRLFDPETGEYVD